MNEREPVSLKCEIFLEIHLLNNIHVIINELMLNFITVIQILSGLATGFLILAHEPKSEGLGSIGGSAHHFKGMQSSAEDKLDQLTWASFILFLGASIILGFNLV